MGGYGSTRWNWHNKRTAVEDCRKLPFRMFKRYLRPGWGGQVTWSREGEVISTIGFVVMGNAENLLRIRLKYAVTKSSGKKNECEYDISLTTTPLPWGGLRYWYLCPNVRCGLRVNVLYLAPGGDYFACRHCQRLSYRSRQEGYQDRAFYGQMARMMQDTHPGITWRMVKNVLER